MAWVCPADRHRTRRELTQVLLEILGVPPTWDIARSSGSLKEEESKSAGSDTTKWKILDIREL